MYSWNVSHDKFEGCFVGGGIREGVKGVLRQWKPSIPIVLMVINENSEILL